VFPRRSVIASIGAGSCLAASVIAGGYAASGAMPFSEWPGAIFSSKGAAEVAMAPATRAAAPVLTLPATTPKPETKTEVIPLDDAAPATTDSEPAGTTTTATPRRKRATTLPGTKQRTPSDDVPDTSPTTAPTSTATTETPAATAASPAAADGPTQAAAPTPQPTTRKVKLGSVSSTFAGAQQSGSGQPELRVQMAVADADAADATATRTVALSLKLAPTDVAALMRSAQTIDSSNIALETQVDVVDASVSAAGQPTCSDGQCLRVQMKFAPDTRPNPVDGPEVQVLDDGDAISNRVKVVVKIDAAVLGTKPTTPSADPTPDPDPAPGTPSVLSLPLPPAADPATPAAPATDTATVALPDADPASGTPDTAAVQVQAQLEVVDTPAAPAPATDTQAAAAADTSTATTAAQAPAAPSGDCP